MDYTKKNPETLAELERVAYITGDTGTADMLAAIIEGVEAIYAADDVETLDMWEKENGPASEYRDFFTCCFDNLGAHYPCASITSDYDQGVIFQAIRLGEEARDLLQRIALDNGNFADEARALLDGDTQ